MADSDDRPADEVDPVERFYTRHAYPPWDKVTWSACRRAEIAT